MRLPLKFAKEPKHFPEEPVREKKNGCLEDSRGFLEGSSENPGTQRFFEEPFLIVIVENKNLYNFPLSDHAWCSSKVPQRIVRFPHNPAGRSLRVRQVSTV